ncbi:restriction endonuclease subunit S [Lutimonas saemankumensis]|uniref:restriction endonuclease subunit S n=1 Tax=Lutimonas saemankumensis TaxID=483016 RepID=UPI001CD704EC|nr:restriction endonuclease subunit S [Lutimonas saemankumensis]MCA0933245.1 restriction endonuclease subunit S [Lutimonas saemankumensis]
MKWDTELEKIGAKTKYPIGDGDHGSIKPQVYQDNGIPYIRVADISREGYIDKSKMVYIPEEVNEANPKSFLYPGDIVISKTGATIGKVAIIPDDIKLANTTASIGKVSLDFDLANARFVLWCMKSQHFQSQMWRVSHKSAQPGFNVKDLKKFKIPLPPLDQQKKIAAILDAADAYRQKTKALIKKYDELTQSLFLDMFGDPVTNPKGYKIVTLGEVTSKITDGVHFKPDYKESGVEFISVKDITTGVLKFDNCKFISKEDHDKYYKRCNPEYLDILYTKVGATYGRPAIVNVKREFSLYVSAALIKPIKEIINPYYLKDAMANPAIKRQADRSIKGIGVPDLHLNMIRKFLIPLPSMQEQNQFAERVKVIEAQKGQAQDSLAQAENLFNSLLQRAFKGELV